jgi:hypothetical protein
MGTVDIKQQELDFVEQQILTDIFGGYASDRFVYRYGFFKLDLSAKVQKAINDFEGFVKPLMDEDGLIDSTNIKKYFNENLISLPDGKYRLIDIYRKAQPFLSSILTYFGGIK